MTEKVYIARTKMATFVCPKCQKSKTVNVSKYADLDKIVKVNVKCPCGYAYTSILEKRKKFRKETNLPGSYTRYVTGKKVGGGLMIVRDLSTTGMKLQIDADHDCDVGDVIHFGRLLLELELARHPQLRHLSGSSDFDPPPQRSERAPKGAPGR